MALSEAKSLPGCQSFSFSFLLFLSKWVFLTLCKHFLHTSCGPGAGTRM